jgi:hypothetical protein
MIGRLLNRGGTGATPMRVLQFSLKTLAGVVAGTAVACCALVYASNTWSAILYTAAIVFLAFATLAAVYGRERARASWVGCAICGWLYLLLVFGPIDSTRQMTSPGQLNVDSELATTHLARWLYASVLPKLRTPPQIPQRVKLRLTDTRNSAAVALNEILVEDLNGALTLLNSRAISPAAAAGPYYPDETSFIRVNHALWTWLFALAGGIIGSWLYARQGKRAAVSAPHVAV